MAKTNPPTRSELWQSRWDDTVKKENPFATMGRSGATIGDYFAYMSDIVNGLDGVDKNTILLDAAGGCGFLSMYFSPLVKEIHLFDYSEEAIIRANTNCKEFSNIHPYVDNLLKLENTKKKGILFKKILVGGALQYFDDYDELKTILKNIYQVTAQGGRVFLTQTPDLSLREKHIASYQRLDWPEEKIKNAIEEELINRFWVDYDKLKVIALDIGFTQCEQTINNPSLFQSSHMFDFYLVK
ncbi:class I SAM-dependent methyltransferase [Colwelliaceae bacterium 6441]